MPPPERRTDDSIPLRTYLEKRLDDMQSTILSRFDQRDREMDRMETQLTDKINDFAANVDRRFNTVEQYKEQTRHLVEMVKDNFDKRIALVENWKANMEGRMVVFAGSWAVIVVLITVVANYAIRKAFG